MVWKMHSGISLHCVSVAVVFAKKDMLSTFLQLQVCKLRYANKEKSVVSFNRIAIQKKRKLEVGGEHAHSLHCLVVYEILTTTILGAQHPVRTHTVFPFRIPDIFIHMSFMR